MNVDPKPFETAISFASLDDPSNLLHVLYIKGIGSQRIPSISEESVWRD